MRTKVFQSGNSQVVRIPKAFRFDVDEVEIFRRGEEIVLRARPKHLGEAFHLLATPVRRIAIATPTAFPYPAIQ